MNFLFLHLVYANYIYKLIGINKLYINEILEIKEKKGI